MDRCSMIRTMVISEEMTNVRQGTSICARSPTCTGRTYHSDIIQSSSMPMEAVVHEMQRGRMIFRYSPVTAASHRLGLVTRKRSSAFAWGGIVACALALSGISGRQSVV